MPWQEIDALIPIALLIPLAFILVPLLFGLRLHSIFGHIPLPIGSILMIMMIIIDVVVIGFGFRATGRRGGPPMDGKRFGFQDIGDMNIIDHYL